ncbi:sulfur carrier protein ThiS [Fusobacterium perfoetens]|uniref:sulfur carrier protein ThiS n=1 Tax=Fusobacterium perfoetens TaxID=852 RepID=UPI0015A53E8F|nr:sulfur carrier protein ThiS [Fusobacterium perfoetens]MCF2612477.1 sulfur carrier protein ThiS [Fusobacterium perfoetens]
MQIVLNGVSENIEKEMLISEFIEKLSSEKNINLSGAVVLLNDELIKRDNWKDVSIKENDEIEVLTFVSGG